MGPKRARRGRLSAPAISSAFEAIFKGVLAATPWRSRSNRSASMARSNQGVSMKPGQTALTRIFGARARASDSVMVVSAPLDAA